MTYFTGSVLQFGAKKLKMDTTPRYLWPGGAYADASPDPADAQITSPGDATITLLSIDSTASTDADLLTFTVMINGSPTALTVSGPGTQTYFSVSVNVDISTGDLITILVEKAGAINPKIQQVYALLAFHAKRVT